MSLGTRCFLLLVLLGSACTQDDATQPKDAGSQPSGKGGAGGSGQNAPSAGHGGAGSAATSGKGGGSSEAGAAGGCSADCEAGEHCELVQVTCVRAPCPPLPMCVPDGGEKEPTQRDCDPRKITCKRTAPECPEMQVPSVDGSCYGECVDVEACQCTEADACPLSEKYTCHVSAKHCTPYLR
ncbi:MAG TPA: hypothetical protein VFN67_06955 [Polyangiales bacterium]|nr:hypothetical protein [Polyangiales bacterium]